VYVQTNKLGVIHKGVPFGVAECLKITADYLKRAPFYNAWPSLSQSEGWGVVGELRTGSRAHDAGHYDGRAVNAARDGSTVP